MLRAPRLSQRGMALPLALMLLIGLGLVATAAAVLSTTDTRISSSYGTSNNAVAAAEAAIEHGIVELTARARAGQDPDGVQIVSSSLGAFTYTVTAFSKREHAGVGGKDFNGDGDQVDVVRYDRSFGYEEASAATGGHPVKLLVAVATNGRSSAEVRSEVGRDRATGELDGPLGLNSPTNAVMNGSFDVDGRLYTRDGTLVAANSLNPPYGNTTQSKAAAKSDCNYWKAGVKIPAEASLVFSGSMKSVGHTAFDHGGLGIENWDGEDSLETFKFTPEDILGVKPGALDQYKKDASAVPDFENLSGVNYVTSGSVPSKISGSGILIVHNPNYDAKKYDCVNFPTTCVLGYAADLANQPSTLKINANGEFKGIIITDQLIRLNGNFTMLGGLISLATKDIDIPANGSGYLRWSCEVVQDAMDQVGSYSVMLSWEHRVL
ncbi:MAG: hypothetical protein ABR599_10275 [Gemmatimonadota bacterium]